MTANNNASSGTPPVTAITPGPDAYNSNLSSSEMQYIVEGCRGNMRHDGRTCGDYRSYTLTTHSSTSNGNSNNRDDSEEGCGPLALSNGSARILLPGGGTHILCSVKADLVRPAPGIVPSEGVVELHVDHAVSAQSRTASRKVDMELQSLLRRLWLPHAVDLQGLCIVPNQYAWRLSIDLLIFASQGNVVDVCAMVMRAALQQTKLPKITPIAAVLPNNANASSVQKKSSATSDLAVDGDLVHAVSPPGVEDCPVVVTTHIIKCGRQPTIMLLDATTEEEACASCQVSVAVDPKQRVCGIHKHNTGTIAFGMLSSITSTAVQASKHVLELVANENNQYETIAPQDLLQDHFRIYSQ